MTTLILAQAGSNFSGLLMPIALVAVLYFFFIRPQQQKQKEQKKFVDAIKPGDKVVTLGGMHGKVVSVDDLTCVLEIDRGLKATFDKAAISQESSKRVQAEAAA